MDFLSDVEVAEREQAMDRVERFDLGYFDPEQPGSVVEADPFEDDGPEPIREGDRW
jgi:hypothetical protein